MQTQRGGLTYTQIREGQQSSQTNLLMDLNERSRDLSPALRNKLAQFER
jgi:hypothetical protein